MDNVLLTIPEPKSEAEYVAALDTMLAEMRRADEHMDSQRQNIDRLKAETRAIAEHTDAVLADVSRQLDLFARAS